jgi:asparagine synthase (glutamine-hydrolysing)
MCGIAGVAAGLNRERIASAVQAMTDAIAHRGPDDDGAWIGDDFGFGMRRLSIIDLAGGHQPMWDSRSGLRIVYNGEVYNYKAIRAELEKSGLAFRTTSDTEVVLQSLAMKGPEAVHDWNGMFAVAAWYERERKLLLIRDRLGVKPLYYYWDGAVLMFASEIKAFIASHLFTRRLNPLAVWDFLTYKYVPGPHTMWQNVWKLPPGHMLEWSPGNEPRVSQYWKTDVLSVDEPVDIDRKTKEFEELFLDSVSQRLLASDVPVGVMLSGGLDSSAIAAAAVELGHKQFHTFSVAFSEGGEYSELPYARRMAQHLGLQFHEVVIDQRRFLEILPDAVRASDEPLADLTIVPLLALLRLTRRHVKVALSGEGSDEILAGYGFHHLRRKFEAIRHIQRIPSSLIGPLARALRLVSKAYGNKLDRIARVPVSQWNAELNNYMFLNWDQIDKRSLWPTYQGRDSTVILKGMYEQARSQDPLEQFLAVIQKSWLVEDLLMKADKMSMAASVELRVPFLDYRLVEWANRQPIAVKIGRFEQQYVTKHVLRRFAKRRLPQEILDRPKQGFPVPVCRWLSDEAFSRWAAQYVAGDQARLRHLFQPQEMNRQLRRAAAGDQMSADKSWLLIVLETWLREFDVDFELEVSPADAWLAGAELGRAVLPVG